MKNQLAYALLVFSSVALNGGVEDWFQRWIGHRSSQWKLIK
jgi:hypothetical protein